MITLDSEINNLCGITICIVVMYNMHPLSLDLHRRYGTDYWVLRIEKHICMIGQAVYCHRIIHNATPTLQDISCGKFYIPTSKVIMKERSLKCSKCVKQHNKWMCGIEIPFYILNMDLMDLSIISILYSN